MTKASAPGAIPVKSDRLQKALEVGSVTALFPLLVDWPTDELQALLRDCDEYSAACCDSIDRAWESFIFQPANFFGDSRGLDKVRDQKKMQVLAVLSEICSVAFFYLSERGIKTDFPGEDE
jgi:hypothetical protein